MATTLRPGDRIPMSWDDFEASRTEVRSEYVDGHLVVSAGLTRYWIIDPAGPEIIDHAVAREVFVESARLRPGTEATLDLGPTVVTFDPADLRA